MTGRALILFIAALGLGLGGTGMATLEENADEPATTLEPAAPAPAVPLSVGERALLESRASGRLSTAYLELTDTAGNPFLVRQRAAERPQLAGALLVLPATAALVSAEPMIAALLEELPPAGWAVLALPAPVPGAAGDAVLHARLVAAHQHLRAAGASRLVLLGLEDGAARLRDAHAAGCFGDGAVTGFAARGAWPGAGPAARLPLLELLAEGDEHAQRHAEERARAAATHGDQTYRQRRYAGLGRDFAGAASLLARDVRGWLTRLAATP